MKNRIEENQNEKTALISKFINTVRCAYLLWTNFVCLVWKFSIMSIPYGPKCYNFTLGLYYIKFAYYEISVLSGNIWSKGVKNVIALIV